VVDGWIIIVEAELVVRGKNVAVMWSEVCCQRSPRTGVAKSKREEVERRTMSRFINCRFTKYCYGDIFKKDEMRRSL
jgi:hypothetical protein